MKLCNKCKGTGQIPFIKNGKLISNALEDCTCRELPHEYNLPVTPADFDFPCSDTWRGYYFERYGGHDPGAIAASNIPEIEKRINELEETSAKPGMIPRKYKHQIDELRGQVTFLNTKVTELRAKKKQDFY